MCYQTRIIRKKEELEQRFQAKITGMDDFIPQEVFKAFDFPFTPIITREDPELIQGFSWGLIPSWADSSWNRTYTLNARIESLKEKPAFRDLEQQRCLVLVDGFYEWQHQGKAKIKYQIGFGDEPFALAGLYNPQSFVPSYTIVTTEAQGIMREIHNTKLRMPVCMTSSRQMEDWLHGDQVEPSIDFNTYPGLSQQTSLF